MTDTRWNNPHHVPLSNGPLRATTPPAAPRVRLAEDSQLLEYLLPFPMHIIDTRPWSPMHCIIGSSPVQIHKPIPVAEFYEPQERIGNESPDAFCSIIRVFSAAGSTDKHPNPGEVWPVLESLLTWIRVKARHYWLLHGLTGFGALFRGSIITQQGNELGQGNFATYGPNLIVRPLSCELWDSIGSEMAKRLDPPVSESIFCDALVSLVAGDDHKALLELGVACEIEITRLLDDVARTTPDSPGKREYLEKGDWDRFNRKLGTWPQKLDLQRAEEFAPAALPKDWVSIVKDLYRFRSSVAHSGKLSVTIDSVSTYLFASNALFAYCRQQRTNGGLPVYSFPAAESPFGQMIAFVGGPLSGHTSMTSATPS